MGTWQRVCCSAFCHYITCESLLPLLSFSSPVLDALQFIMSFSPVVVPRISISPAPPQDPVIEPYSPFASIKYPDHHDAFRPRLLTPPPSSPLRSCSSPEDEDCDYNEGLDSQRFQALLQATRERNARKQHDLRREVTLRAHQTKQIERRARFVTRVLARPTMTAVNSPPSLPAPSPSPDAMPTFVKPDPLSFLHGDEHFCSRDEDLSNSTISPTIRGSSMPSLEEIRVRLVSKQRTIAALDTSGTKTLSTDSTDLRAPQPRISPKFYNRFAPPTESTGQTRASRAQDMLSALKRRTSPPIIDSTERDQEDKKRKRHSAPGDLFPSREREGFQHPVLVIPGSF